jgi:RNA polymerase sigma factor (sigma-70 family)
MSSTAAPSLPASNAWFVTTRWSVVLAARDKESPQASKALETLCTTYWYPLYAFVRRQGRSPEDAQDITQEFFARLLEKDQLRPVAQEKGKFRTFLLVALRRFMANELDRAHAQKRGGGVAAIPFDTELAESRYATDSSVETAERIFDRRWALALLEQTLARVREEYAEVGKLHVFHELKGFLTAEEREYREAAARLQMGEGALRVAVHRLRKRYREIFREEIAHTVSSTDEIDGEVRYLMDVLAG